MANINGRATLYNVAVRDDPLLKTTHCVWTNMKQRCNNPKNTKFKQYGGRGITYASTWENFKMFVADMGLRPGNLTLDRKDVNKGYCKENCRWATLKEQNRNTQRTRYILVKGVKHSLKYYCEEHGINQEKAASQFKRGWTGDEIAQGFKCTKVLEYASKRYSYRELAEELGMKTATLQARMAAGWSSERILNTPVSKSNNKFRGDVLVEG